MGVARFVRILAAATLLFAQGASTLSASGQTRIAVRNEQVISQYCAPLMELVRWRANNLRSEAPQLIRNESYAFSEPLLIPPDVWIRCQSYLADRQEGYVDCYLYPRDIQTVSAAVVREEVKATVHGLSSCFGKPAEIADDSVLFPNLPRGVSHHIAARWEMHTGRAAVEAIVYMREMGSTETTNGWGHLMFGTLR